jgi:hypothetical protein
MLPDVNVGIWAEEDAIQDCWFKFRVSGVSIQPSRQPKKQPI